MILNKNVNDRQQRQMFLLRKQKNNKKKLHKPIHVSHELFCFLILVLQFSLERVYETLQPHLEKFSLEFLCHLQCEENVFPCPKCFPQVSFQITRTHGRMYSL